MDIVRCVESRKKRWSLLRSMNCTRSRVSVWEKLRVSHHAALPPLPQPMRLRPAAQVLSPWLFATVLS